MDTLESVRSGDESSQHSFTAGDKIQHGPSVTKFPLHEAASAFNCEQLKVLLNKGWNPNEKDENGKTVLHHLLSNGFLGHLYETSMEECVACLLGNMTACDVNVSDQDQPEQGETPLSLAVSNGFVSCAKLLVQHGADPTVSTRKYKRMHSLSTVIAQTMPDVMLEILNSGVLLDFPDKGEGSNTNGPNVRVKLDWSPVVQFSQVTDGKVENKLRKHKYKQREMSFLYSLLDVSPNIRNTYLTHPLISAFLYLKSEAISKKLQWFQLLMSLHPIFYMTFIYFLYFNRCKFKDDDDSGSTISQNSDTFNLTNDSFLRNVSNPHIRVGIEDKKSDQLCEISWAISLAAYALAVVVCGFALLEVFVQFRVDTTYLKNWRTWVFRVALIIMGLTLWPALQFNTLYNITWQYPIAALGTFFAWVMFLIQMELIPQVKIYLEMLVAITLSVLRIVLLFLPLLIGFYMGFNLMFFKIGGVMNFILMTVDVGSNEYEDMMESAKDSRPWFTIIAYIFSVGFIIIIAIVFMNFLLGVSINDIQELKKNAKIMALSNRVQKLFIIDLIFPTRYNVLNEQGERYYIYGPYDKTFTLPEEIRTQLTLILKIKYGTGSTTNGSNWTPFGTKL